jgi:hypothetical protein
MRLARAVVVSLMTLTALACAPYTERTLLTRFFAASRLRDLTALRKFSTIVFEPASDGIVTEFEIQMVRERAGSKEVWLTAPVRLPDGRTVTKDFAVTIQGGLVTGISERPALRPGSGRAAASTPPR